MRQDAVLKNVSAQRIYGLMVEFDTPESLLDAARKTWERGYRHMDAYSPFPVEGLAEAVGFRFNLLPWLVLLAGFGGAAGGYFMEWFASAVNYPINVGGRPLNSWPSFVPVTFELGVLCASLTALIAMCWLSGLPRPYHPVFNAPEFSLATRDRFFLCVQADDPIFDIRWTREFLSEITGHEVTEVAHWKP